MYNTLKSPYNEFILSKHRKLNQRNSNGNILSSLVSQTIYRQNTVVNNEMVLSSNYTYDAFIIPKNPFLYSIRALSGLKVSGFWFSIIVSYLILRNQRVKCKGRIFQCLIFAQISNPWCCRLIMKQNSVI